MNSNSAADNLQVIRTLMERATLYRRALAPITLFTGGLGVLAGIVALLLRVESLRGFGLFWLGVAGVAVAGAFLLARRQSLKDKEPFWSPPTRRVAQALSAPFTVGLLVSVLAITAATDQEEADAALPVVWMLCYGCALHAAGFFAPRGVRLLGWLFILSACGVFCTLFAPEALRNATSANIVMGLFFGVVHLVYGAYLHFTEKRKDAA
jgi:membrane protease YdiL (CAAX protease family)